MKNIEKHLKNKTYARVRHFGDIGRFSVSLFFCILIFKMALWGYKNGYSDTEDMYLMMLIIAPLMQIGFTYYTLFHKKLYDGVVSSKDIYSVNREKDIYGSFVLGCGSIDTINYYYFYEEGEFGKKIGKVQVNELEIIESNKYNPSIKEVMVEGYSKRFMFVPKNTIKQEFKL